MIRKLCDEQLSQPHSLSRKETNKNTTILQIQFHGDSYRLTVYFASNLLKGNAAYLKKKIIMDENDALSEYNKIPLGHNRTNGAVYSKIYFKVEIFSTH